MRVTKAGDVSVPECACADQMDGTYECIFPASWTAHKGGFDFVLSQGGQNREFVPVRTLVDRTTGAESLVNTYTRLGVIVPPILCQEAHSHPNAEGAECVQHPASPQADRTECEGRAEVKLRGGSAPGLPARIWAEMAGEGAHGAGRVGARCAGASTAQPHRGGWPHS